MAIRPTVELTGIPFGLFITALRHLTAPTPLTLKHNIAICKAMRTIQNHETELQQTKPSMF